MLHTSITIYTSGTVNVHFVASGGCNHPVNRPETEVIAVKYKVGDWVEVSASGMQGEVVEVDKERGLVKVDLRSFIGTYTAPMLRMKAPGA